uniref:Uncharacterized protein n=1 Tax=Oryza brachyantha TaxID=4533 RepID=J3MQT0_ORYBR
MDQKEELQIKEMKSSMAPAATPKQEANDGQAIVTPPRAGFRISAAYRPHGRRRTPRYSLDARARRRRIIICCGVTAAAPACCSVRCSAASSIADSLATTACAWYCG